MLVFFIPDYWVHICDYQKDVTPVSNIEMYRKRYSAWLKFFIKHGVQFLLLVWRFHTVGTFVYYTLIGSVLNAVIHFTFSLPLATIFSVYAYSGFEEKHLFIQGIQIWLEAKANLRKLRLVHVMSPRTVKKKHSEYRTYVVQKQLLAVVSSVIYHK